MAQRWGRGGGRAWGAREGHVVPSWSPSSGPIGKKLFKKARGGRLHHPLLRAELPQAPCTPPAPHTWASSCSTVTVTVTVARWAPDTRACFRCRGGRQATWVPSQRCRWSACLSPPATPEGSDGGGRGGGEKLVGWGAVLGRPWPAGDLVWRGPEPWDKQSLGWGPVGRRAGGSALGWVLGRVALVLSQPPDLSRALSQPRLTAPPVCTHPPPPHRLPDCGSLCALQSLRSRAWPRSHGSVGSTGPRTLGETRCFQISLPETEEQVTHCPLPETEDSSQSSCLGLRLGWSSWPWAPPPSGHLAHLSGPAGRTASQVDRPVQAGGCGDRAYGFPVHGGSRGPRWTRDFLLGGACHMPAPPGLGKERIPGQCPGWVGDPGLRGGTATSR